MGEIRDIKFNRRGGRPPGESRPRRLAAILAADIAGYSRLMEQDEEGTHARVKRIERDLVEPSIAEHHGRLVKTTGDGFFAIFDSPVEAVRCSIVIQQNMIGRNASLPKSSRIDYRIGVNLGDVIIEPDDIYGDGVNVAARIEGIAEPGHVYVSGAIYEQIKHKLVCGYEPLGDHKVKNITDPVRIYRVLPDAAAVDGTRKRRENVLIVLLGLSISAIAGVVLWYQIVQPRLTATRTAAITTSPTTPAQAPAPAPGARSPAPSPATSPSAAAPPGPAPTETKPATPQPAPVKQATPQPSSEAKAPEAKGSETKGSETKALPERKAPPPEQKATAPEPKPDVPEVKPPPPVPQPAPPAATQAPEPKPPPAPQIREPEMVGLRGGSFQMGSNEDPTERPPHHVAVKPFSIGKYPVSVREWNDCAAAKACGFPASGADDAPMANVSWNDARQYAAWLAAASGKPYRLPSEAEWEYAARGGTQSRYWWGDQMQKGLADCKDCGDGPAGAQPAAPGSLKANPFGLHGMGGGVDQWVEDCWHKTYQGAPSDGSAWTDGGDCSSRVLRSGSWKNDFRYVRPANRDKYDAAVRYPTHGFRVALTPNQ